MVNRPEYSNAQEAETLLCQKGRKRPLFLFMLKLDPGYVAFFKLTCNSNIRNLLVVTFLPYF